LAKVRRELEDKRMHWMLWLHHVDDKKPDEE
jgi:hypothetical protein